FAKCLLPRQQRLTNGRQRCDLGSAGAGCLGTYSPGHVFAFENDALFLVTVSGNKAHIQVRRQGSEDFLVGQIRPVVTRGKSQYSVQRARIQQMPAQTRGQHARQRALAGTTGAIDGDDRDHVATSSHALSSWRMLMPTERARSTNPG